MVKSFSIGVLIIGSLIWDNSKERNHWRTSRLDQSTTFDVYAPIRYGRKSESRGNTFTMVFSPSCLPGRAKVIRYLNSIASGRDLVNEAEALWAAERNSLTTNGQISSGWGCVSLMTNPESKIESNILRYWANKTAEFARLPCLPEEDPLVRNGLLQIQWPNIVDGGRVPLDLLLATATAAEVTGNPPAYPSAKDVANAWKLSDKQYSQYFLLNRKNGIFTFQDEDIAQILGTE